MHCSTSDINEDGICFYAEQGQVEEVKRFLVEHGSGDVGGLDEPLRLAAQGATELHAETVRLLVSNGANVNARGAYGKTALHLAALESAELPTVSLLLEQGASPNSQDIWGKTPLHCICYCWGDAEQAKRLLQHGADVDALDECLHTPAHAAASRGNASMVELLAAYGADLNLTDNVGRTPLHLACSSVNRHPTVVNVLLKHSADVHIADGFGNTALHTALERSLSEETAEQIVVALLDNGARVDVLNRAGRSPYDNTFNDNGQSRRVTYMLELHAVKLRVAGLAVSITFDPEVHDRLKSFFCEEFSRIKTTKISKLNYSLSIVFCLAKQSYINKQQMFEALEQLMPQFPYYGKLMRSLVLQAKEWVVLFDQACLSFRYETRLEMWSRLPYLAVREILYFLDHNDLRNFIRSG